MLQLASLVDELRWRGLLHQYTEGVEEWLARGPLSAYVGFDPTASSLHVGNLVPVMGLVHVQRTGNRPIALVGGGTGLIGDPSGKSAERPFLEEEIIAENARAIGAQLERFLDFDGANAAVMMDNAAWLRPLRMVDFLRDVGKHFTVNYMTAKESVKSRLEEGISFTEFSYMLVQAYDYLQLHQREGVTLQLGGSDQWGNILTGVELIRRTTGHEAHAITHPLVTAADGKKFGKTEAGAVWLDPTRTSPYRFFQFWINADDRDVGRYMRLFTLLSREEIAALETELREHPERRGAQRALALDVTARVHGDEVARVVAAASNVLFGEGEALTPDVLRALWGEIPSVEVPLSTLAADDDAGQVDTVKLIVAARLAPSKGAARRLLQQGGIYLNNERLGAEQTRVPPSARLHGRYFFLRRGKREYALVAVRESSL
ncbi:MAG: tyrosine--tRNA ligase [Gemmatimonadaceae bacterium]